MYWLAPYGHDAASGAVAARLLPDGAEHVGFVPGSSAGRANKRWPLERYVEVARRQAVRGRVPVFILGPEEAAWHADLARDVPQALFPLQEAAAAGERTGPLLTIALALVAGFLSHEPALIRVERLAARTGGGLEPAGRRDGARLQDGLDRGRARAS